MSQTVGDFIVERLHAWGVRRIYGYPGDGINGVFGALNRAEGDRSSPTSHRFSRCVTKKWPHSWRRHTRNSPANSAYASPLQGRARRI